MVVADLHMHSTFSDGCFGPSLIVEQACKLGLKAIAITDHDWPTRVEHPDSLMVIPGIEMTTQLEGRSIHLLGYFIDPTYRPLLQACEETRCARAAKALRIAENLEHAGYDIHPAQLIERDTVLNRVAIARELVRVGAVGSIAEAFRDLIGSNSAYYSEQKYIDTREAITLVRESGGLPFIAHPAHYKVVDLIVPLKACGLFGVEVFHSRHSAAQSAELVALARENDLAVSGGSDWHGDTANNAILGCAGLDEAGFEAFLSACVGHSDPQVSP